MENNYEIERNKEYIIFFAFCWFFSITIITVALIMIGTKLF